MKNKKETKNNKWQFKILSNVDIDYEIIQSELTRKNPIALITFGEEKFVCIHKSIIDKSAICRILLPNRIEKIVDGIVIYEIKGNFSEWIKWAKEVKNASWPWIMKNKQTVKIVLPTI